MNYQIRFASPEDGEKMHSMLPRLAAFQLPENRRPEDTYSGDAKMLRRWIDGKEQDCFVYIAFDDSNEILGWSYVRMQAEFMSYEPGCHLEVILVNDAAAGQGIGQALLNASETEAKKRGAKSMTLHVWKNNTRARTIYEKNGFTDELSRYVKWL